MRDGVAPLPRRRMAGARQLHAEHDRGKIREEKRGEKVGSFDQHYRSDIKRCGPERKLARDEPQTEFAPSESVFRRKILELRNESCVGTPENDGFYGVYDMIIRDAVLPDLVPRVQKIRRSALRSRLELGGPVARKFCRVQRLLLFDVDVVLVGRPRRRQQDRAGGLEPLHP
mmetsp:Transcript_5364/g.11053  ORF Transcript_5364/g.11053 Transcript_5364/m.11053 type:complete len:172 (-) Transcript_5364:1463-1978(-)